MKKLCFFPILKSTNEDIDFLPINYSMFMFIYNWLFFQQHPTYEMLRNPKTVDELIHLARLLSAFLVTILTVYRSGSIGFEGNLSFFSTFCASYFMHFTRASIKPSSFFVFSIHVTSFLLFVSFWHKAKAYKPYWCLAVDEPRRHVWLGKCRNQPV